MIKLNCDLGESFGAWQMGQDKALMPHIDMANIACGFHASDPQVMAETVRLCLAHQVVIGAHPGYPDLQGFGRRAMHFSADEIKHLVLYQVGALQAIADAQGGEVAYIKPHGALYHAMMKQDEAFEALLSCSAQLKRPLPIMLQSLADMSRFEQLASQYRIPLIYEVFADRQYMRTGLLVPRSEPDAVIHDLPAVKQRIQLLTSKGTIVSREGEPLALKADTLCVHGDTPESVDFVIMLREELNRIQSD